MGVSTELNKDSYNKIRKVIIVKTNSEDEEQEVLHKFHERLKGQEDYKESRIVLNDYKTRKLVDPSDDTENEVHLYVFDDSTIDIEPSFNICK